MVEPDEMDAVAVIDVTDELIGERREEWRAGFDFGRTMGVRGVLRAKDGGSPDGLTCIEQMALDLKVHRLMNDVLVDVGVQRERLLAHWKAEAQWWQEEHDRVHREFCEFTTYVANRFCK